MFQVAYSNYSVQHSQNDLVFSLMDESVDVIPSQEFSGLILCLDPVLINFL